MKMLFSILVAVAAMQQNATIASAQKVTPEQKGWDLFEWQTVVGDAGFTTSKLREAGIDATAHILSVVKFTSIAGDKAVILNKNGTSKTVVVNDALLATMGLTRESFKKDDFVVVALCRKEGKEILILSDKVTDPRIGDKDLDTVSIKGDRGCSFFIDPLLSR